MSNLKFCQGPDCHTYHTQDRLKGTKENKTYQTRRRSNFYYGNGNFCSWNCLNDWHSIYIEQALDHFGRTTEVKHLTKENAWVKGYDWNRITDDCEHHTVNIITKEQRPLTKEQFNDSNYTINTGE